MNEVNFTPSAKPGIHMKNVSIKTVLLIAALGLSAAGCSTITESPDRVTGVIDSDEPAPVLRQVGQPYVIKGVRYVPHEDPDYNAVGTASWYGQRFHGRKTASGQIYNMNALTAAHPTLPFGTQVRVTNLANHRSVALTVNDRGPFAKGRIIDVSRHAAEHLGVRRAGSTRVRVEVMQAAAVRVWYTPGKKYGVRSYPAHGFIYPESPMAANSAQQGFLADPASWPTGHPPADLI